MAIYRTRPEAIRAEQAALDDIARCSRALDLIRKLTLILQPYPKLIKTLYELTQIVIAMKREAQERRAQASEQI